MEGESAAIRERAISDRSDVTLRGPYVHGLGTDSFSQRTTTTFETVTNSKSLLTRENRSVPFSSVKGDTSDTISTESHGAKKPRGDSEHERALEK